MNEWVGFVFVLFVNGAIENDEMMINGMTDSE